MFCFFLDRRAMDVVRNSVDFYLFLSMAHRYIYWGRLHVVPCKTCEPVRPSLQPPLHHRRCFDGLHYYVLHDVGIFEWSDDQYAAIG